MDDRSFTYVFKNNGCSYSTRFEFGKPGSDDSIHDFTIGNSDFLEESSVINGLMELTGMEGKKLTSLLSGDLHISDIPELDHTRVLDEKTRRTVDGYYFYSLQNGVVIFGLDRTHEIMKLVDTDTCKHDLKVVYYVDLLSNISTESRAKRRRNRSFKLSNICSISISNSTYQVNLPGQLSNLEVIETNPKLASQPELLLTEEGWLLILLDKNKTMLHRKVNKLLKKKCS